jgi:hypothetical protein
MAGMDMSDHGPFRLMQQGHEAARGFGCIAAALRRPDHHPGNLGRTGGGTARGQRRLHCLTRENRPVGERSSAPTSRWRCATG